MCPDNLGNEDLRIAFLAVSHAAKIILQYWASPVETYKTKADTHFDLVSLVDEAADAAIHAVLRAHCPKDLILSEEISPNTVIDTAVRTWIVDPLDGTSSYLFKTDASAPSVMIALMHNGACTLSVICQPMLNQWTYAMRNSGTYQWDGSNTCRMYMNTATKLSTSWIDMNHYGGIEFESTTFRKIDAIVRSSYGARLVTRSVPHSAIALRLLTDNTTSSANLGACVHDHNPLKPKQLPWDIVPVQLIIEEAGGVYMDVLRGPNEQLNPFALSGPILIAPRGLAEEIYQGLA